MKHMISQSVGLQEGKYLAALYADDQAMLDKVFEIVFGQRPLVGEALRLSLEPEETPHHHAKAPKGLGENS
tara:strand:+ start:1101 stop:1313 length:213 start_codon:yes stop_codon:yes gene_type:complete